jgi:hypothetical protein
MAWSKLLVDAMCLACAAMTARSSMELGARDLVSFSENEMTTTWRFGTSFANA